MAARSRSGSTRPAIKRTKPVSASVVDKLAKELSETLTVSDGKGKQKVDSNRGPEATKLASMRAVNTASQALLNVVQSGWKKSSSSGGSSKVPLETVNSAAADAAKHLGILRRISPGDIDVERAAVSVLGKLMTLEMHDLAAAALENTHPRICQIVNGSDESRPVGQSKYLSVPRSSIPTDPVLLNLLSTYLLYALVLASRPGIANPDSIQELSTTLHSSSTHSMLSWMSDFSSLPTKHLDSLLTRAYTSLTKFCSSSTTVSRKPLPKAKLTVTSINPTSSPSPEALFHLRTYALRCLAYTSPGIVEGNTFWDQATKFASLFIRATTTSPVSEEHATSVILTSFAQIVKIAEVRDEKEVFMAVDGDNGKKFVDFCDYWSSIAKRAGDISLLQRINTLMHKSSPLASSPVKSSPQHCDTPGISGNKQMLMVEGTKICNTFAQLSLLLEQLLKTNGCEQENDSYLLSLIGSCTTSFQSPEMGYYITSTLSQSTQSSDDELGRVCAKVKRAVEKVRRLGVKALELIVSPSSVSSSTLADALSTLLLACVACLQSTIAEQTLTPVAICDPLTRLLDTLFVLSRLKLKINDPTTFILSYEFLSQASLILNSITISPEIAPSPPDLDIANYTRCVSGAFYNIAGTLYQATRYGNAVPFLVESCMLGEKALGLRGSTRPVRETETESRETEWKQLEDQLYRRWELLGVCYSKNGDRKKAFEAFKQAISMFPYSSSGIVERTSLLTPGAVFGEDSGTAVKQLVSLVDRTTYLGACELFLPPHQISLRSDTAHGVNQQDASVVGALIECQLSSLEPSQWKEAVRNVTLHLLKDALEIYTSVTGAEAGGPSVVMPIRKARVLVRCLEFAYRDSTTAVESISAFGFENVVGVAGEVERLCTKQALGKDTSLAQFGLQYRIAAHLWVALHAHRRSDPDQNMIMTQQSEEACRLLRILLGQEPAASPKTSKVIASPRVVIKRAVGSPKVARIVSPKTTRVTRRVPAAPRKGVQMRKFKTKVVEDPVTPKPKMKTSVQPVHTPPRDGKPAVIPAISFDNFEGLMKLLQHVARILGLLSLILAKAHILDMARKIAQHHLGTKSDEYIISSLDLAHEYVTLGKLKRAASIFNLALEVVRNHEASPDVSVRFLLRFSESLALFEDIPASAAVYLEAFELSKGLELEEKGMTTCQRICARAKVLEVAATAAHVFATVQFAKGDVGASLEGSLQALRLWNRATDTMLRLRPSTSTTPDNNPFEMSTLKEALPLTGSGVTGPHKSTPNAGRPATSELQWRVSEGLLSTIFFLTEIYFLKGSPREADYFARQAAEFAEQLNVPAMASRAFAKQGEIQMHMGRLQEAHLSLMKATNLLQDMPGLDAADVLRLRLEYNMKVMEGHDPTELFDETMRMIEELDNAFRQFDSRAFGPRRSLGSSPRPKTQPDILAPALLSSILSQQLWLLRNNVGDHFDAILEKFLSLSYTTTTKAAENALLANLTLHSIYGRFQGDMFLSSLTESTIAVPMCMRGKENRKSMATSDIVDALSKAENLLSEYLNISTAKGSVIKVREAAISLVLVYAFRTSLGDRRPNLPSVMAKLLDASACLTLCRDMLEAIDQKFPPTLDDLQWPSLAQGGEALPRLYCLTTRKPRAAALSDSDSDDEDNNLMLEAEQFIRDYWMRIQDKYRSLLDNPSTGSSSEMTDLPSNWTVVNINITPDKNTLFCCRREGGERSLDPLIFCIPLRGRRDHGDGNDDEEYLTFDGALQELQDIIRSSDDSTKAAISIKSDDEEARSNWWEKRSQLDARLKELLENIEYCWLGAFKTILSPRSGISPETISDIREQLQRVFLQYLHMKGKKPTNPMHKRTTSNPRSHTPSQLKLDDTFIRSFCDLSPKCRDEELEDLVYFILDLYQHHGVPVAISEVDIDQVVIDLRTLLEEHAAKQLKLKNALKVPSNLDEHLFLVLDKNIQGIPWESLPILRGRSVSRIPGVQFLHDRIAFAKRKREAVGQVFDPKLGAALDSRKGYFILNPSGDLDRTEERFRGWASNMKAAGWSGTIGRPISEQEFVDALKLKDFVVYFGHGGGEQYIRSQKIRNLPTCAATMLWGCSSGALRELGDFDRTGTPYNYMLAGCPTLVANLWDVTDKDIDKVCQSVFDKLSLNGKNAQGESTRRGREALSLVTAVAQSRDCCKLKYLTGAAPVVYGIPFYL